MDEEGADSETGKAAMEELEIEKRTERPGRRRHDDRRQNGKRGLLKASWLTEAPVIGLGPFVSARWALRHSFCGFSSVARLQLASLLRRF